MNSIVVTGLLVLLASTQLYADPLADARAVCATGSIDAGMKILRKADLIDSDQRSTHEQLDAKLVMADCYRVMGMNAQLRDTLVSGLQQSNRAQLANYAVEFLRRLADFELRRGAADDARALLDQALISLPADDPDGHRAELLLMFGNAYSLQDQFEDAESRYRESASAADANGNIEGFIDATLNLTRVLVEQLKHASAVDALAEAREMLDGLPNTAWQAQRLAAIGELYHRIDADRNEAAHVKTAVAVLDEAAASARAVDDARAESLALGHLGSIAERFSEWDKALAYTRVAVLRGQQAGALDLLYQWQWQAARILEANGERGHALAAYRQSVSTLEVIRPELLRGSARTFKQVVAPLFFGMANLLLTEHDGEQDLEIAQAHLRQVQGTMEQFKVAEIRDYFNEECVVIQETQADLVRLAENAAIIYPIIFDDRLEVLSSYRGRIHRHTASVSRRELGRTVREFRRELVRRPNHAYRLPGQALYRWIIEAALPGIRAAGIDTLVFVPDGPLRTVPPAAFFDGSRFLIEEFAVSSSLGLTLTSPQPIERESAHVLASGLTVPVENFKALPGVAAELDRISGLYRTTEYRDQDFRLGPMSQQLSEGQYSIVHIATHGQFKADFRESFLLAYDGRMTMDVLEANIGLRRYLNQPVELLMLSACETAVGDDRAALGLAGVALKAGARSAVASLWSISDDSTSMLVGDFYEQLKNPKMTKAMALRDAQIAVLSEQRFRHPFYWSPYLLIGNWL